MQGREANFTLLSPQVTATFLNLHKPIYAVLSSEKMLLKNFIVNLPFLLYNTYRQKVFNDVLVKVNIKEKIMAKVTKEMSILEIVQNCPESVEVFRKYGLGCLGCAAARFENLEAGARVHGFDADEMIDEINNLIEE